jgi:outer membrane lipoprotein-sorting protein
MKRITFVVLFLALVFVFAVGAPATDATPSVNEILDKYLEAIGGTAAIDKITSRVSRGTVEVVGMDTKGTVEIYEKAPDKLVRIVKIPGVFAWASGFNSTLGWAFNQESGKVQVKKGKELAAAKFEASFYRNTKLNEYYPRMSLKGVEKIQYRDEKRETYVIEATPNVGNTERFYFDTTNGLLIRHDTQEESEEEGKITVVEYLLDYTAVDGVKLPFTSRQRQGTAVFIFRLTDVKQNVTIDDARFDKPAVR